MIIDIIYDNVNDLYNILTQETTGSETYNNVYSIKTNMDINKDILENIVENAKRIYSKIYSNLNSSLHIRNSYIIYDERRKIKIIVDVRHILTKHNHSVMIMEDYAEQKITDIFNNSKSILEKPTDKELKKQKALDIKKLLGG